MVRDIVLDTHVLTEFIAQYFERRLYEENYVVPNQKITVERAKLINDVLKEFYSEGAFSKGLIVTSLIGIIEIGRKFIEVSGDRYSILQFKTFIAQLPPYFDIAPIENSLIYLLYQVPKFVHDGHEKRIELADAIHCATYFSRDCALLFTDDEKIRLITTIDVL